MRDAKSELLVFLKDVDLVADTALLALKGKMGYESCLAGLRRFEYYRFNFLLDKGKDAQGTLEDLERALSSQSTFYNRNKHNLLLELQVGDAALQSGISRDALIWRFSREVSKSRVGKEITNFNIQSDAERVILEKGDPFLGELLVQEKESSTRESLAKKLSGEMGRPINFEAAGVLWWLALLTENEGRARELIAKLAVSVSRDRGLFLNPHYQEYRILGVRELVV